MTIHSDHPFLPPEDQRDAVRQFRGRLGPVVTLWTAGDDTERAGLTVSSIMVAGGEPDRVLALLDPDSDLRERIEDTGAAVVHLLAWQHRDLADAFAGVAPAPGGPFRMADWEQTSWGPRLTTAATWARVRLESATGVGWSDLVTCTVEHVTIGDDGDTEGAEPLVHRRGRYQRP